MFNSRRYTRDLLLALGAYVLLLCCSLWGLLAFEPGQMAAAALAVLPMGGALLIVWVILRHFARMDELQRRIQVEAFAIAALLVCVVTFTIGFLGNAGLPQPSMIWVLPAIVGTWGLVTPILRKRYS